VSNEAQTVEIFDDLLLGVKAIARFLGQPERKIYHLIEQGHLPGTFKLGERQHAALKSVLTANLHAKAKGAAREMAPT